MKKWVSFRLKFAVFEGFWAYQLVFSNLTIPVTERLKFSIIAFFLPIQMLNVHFIPTNNLKTNNKSWADEGDSTGECRGFHNPLITPFHYLTVELNRQGSDFLKKLRETHIYRPFGYIYFRVSNKRTGQAKINVQKTLIDKRKINIPRRSQSIISITDLIDSNRSSSILIDR